MAKLEQPLIEADLIFEKYQWGKLVGIVSKKISANSYEELDEKIYGSISTINRSLDYSYQFVKLCTKTS